MSHVRYVETAEGKLSYDLVPTNPYIEEEPNEGYDYPEDREEYHPLMILGAGGARG